METRKTIIKEIQCGTIAKFIFDISESDRSLNQIWNQFATAGMSNEEIENRDFNYYFRLKNVEIFKHPKSGVDIYVLGTEALKEINQTIEEVTKEIKTAKLKDYPFGD